MKLVIKETLSSRISPDRGSVESSGCLPVLIADDGTIVEFANPLVLYFSAAVRDGFAIAEWSDADGSKRSGLVTSLDIEKLSDSSKKVARKNFSEFEATAEPAPKSSLS